MRDFNKLEVWSKAHELTLCIYDLTSRFPREEMFGLTSQLRRAAVSIPSNIAEGCGREGDAELARFLRISMGSASEAEYQLRLSRDLNYLTEEEYEAVRSMLFQLKKMQVRFLQRLTVDEGRLLVANRQEPRANR